MNDESKLTERLCCMINPYFTCEGCKDVFCQLHLYSWVAARNHPIPSNKECGGAGQKNAYWKCTTTGKYLGQSGTIL